MANLRPAVYREGAATQAKALPPPETKMNNLESAYAAFLEAKRRQGDIARWDFQPVRLRLADGAWYTPDFRVIQADQTEEMHETKGFYREASRVRLLVAADRHPYRFFLVRLDPSKGWQVEEVRG